MPTYIKTTNFLAKDSLPLNNAAKYVKGSEIDTEFDNMETADTDNMKKSAMGTGVENALLVNVGSAGAFSTAVAASQSDQETGTSTTVYVSPGRQQYHPSAAKAWFSWTYSAGTPVIDQSYNVTSLTDTGVGVVVANLTVAMSTTKFPPFASSSTDQNAYTTAAKNISAGTIRVHLYDTTNAAADGAGAAGGFGDQ